MKHLCIDYGERRIGLAVSDDDGTLALPWGVRERKGRKPDALALLEVARGVGAQRLVFGSPRTLSGEAGEAEAKVRAFAAKVQNEAEEAGLTLEIAWWDERFSTQEALRGLRDAGISQRQARDDGGAGSTDARAAAVILQGYLDNRRQETGYKG